MIFMGNVEKISSMQVQPHEEKSGERFVDNSVVIKDFIRKENDFNLKPKSFQEAVLNYYQLNERFEKKGGSLAKFLNQERPQLRLSQFLDDVFIASKLANLDPAEAKVNFRMDSLREVKKAIVWPDSAAEAETGYEHFAEFLVQQMINRELSVHGLADTAFVKLTDLLEDIHGVKGTDLQFDFGTVKSPDGEIRVKNFTVKIDLTLGFSTRKKEEQLKKRLSRDKGAGVIVILAPAQYHEGEKKSWYKDCAKVIEFIKNGAPIPYEILEHRTGFITQKFLACLEEELQDKEGFLVKQLGEEQLKAYRQAVKKLRVDLGLS